MHQTRNAGLLAKPGVPRHVAVLEARSLLRARLEHVGRDVECEVRFGTAGAFKDPSVVLVDLSRINLGDSSSFYRPSLSTSLGARSLEHHCSSSYDRAVNFNVYVDDELARKLEALAKRTGARRNAIIRQAIAAWVRRAGSSWPTIVAEWRGDPAAPRFEDTRFELAEPAADPFSPTTRAGGTTRRRPRSTRR